MTTDAQEPAPVGLLENDIEFRVVCADGEVRAQRRFFYGDSNADRVTANDWRYYLDNDHPLHMTCTPHVVQERTVTYGEWQ